MDKINESQLNISIVQSDIQKSLDLKSYLLNRFGKSLNITIFYNGSSLLTDYDPQTDIVILGYYLAGDNGTNVLSEIKKTNPKTNVIMYTSNIEIEVSIEAFKRGASDYLFNFDKSLDNIGTAVLKVLLAPINHLEKEYRVSRYLTMFVMTFVVIGLAVSLYLNIM
jgi:DNA-binding NtrC family response regulator